MYKEKVSLSLHSNNDNIIKSKIICNEIMKVSLSKIKFEVHATAIERGLKPLDTRTDLRTMIISYSLPNANKSDKMLQCSRV
jgi:hypothetical protein